ncbi:Imm1 family immunity protein [Umezawaea tangerina]|uniref:Immunity protein Imm1 of predicted polymorphic toxin system n=1 Tax=Umezawaea tangerina TaxID=84725 RepID=A0A2T0TE34_9PSEU|nr:Imm1 family immunity protein [Umezawaea tangerina]PRY43929.1 immunity protein Imm1 of predicted polymorphic toxin system [Umezawaea tangerina]
MGSLNAYYARDHAAEPVTLSTSADVAAFVERLRARSLETGPLLAQVYLTDDVHAQELSAGVDGDRGVLRYAGREWFEGVYSLGDEAGSDEALVYYYMDNDTEFPPNSQVSVDVVRRAVEEYLRTNGERPTGVRWQADR